MASTTVTETHAELNDSVAGGRIFIRGATYILPVDTIETKRLKLQHECIKGAYGGRLLLAPHSKEEAYFILDSATGTGTWLLDFAAQMHPSCIIHGADLEGNRFPVTHPPNACFSTNSVLALPHAWSSKFDYVHQRLLMSALTRADWPKAVSEIYRVLAPGGWAQLGEYGYWGAQGPKTDAFMRVYSLLYKHSGLVQRVYAELPDLLREAGFTRVQVERRGYPLGGKAGKDGTENLVNHCRSVKERIMKAGGFGLVSGEEELDAMIDEMAEEWEQIEGCEAEFIYVFGQKPIHT